MNSPGALNVKSNVKTREHDSRREPCISREPPGYYFGERVSLHECSSRWPWSDVFSTWTLLPGASINKGMLDFLSEEKTMCCTKLLLERSVYCQEQDGKPPDEPPTDQEHRPGDRADEAHRARLIARSIISFGCLSLVKSVFVFVYHFF